MVFLDNLSELRLENTNSLTLRIIYNSVQRASKNTGVRTYMKLTVSD